MTILCIGGTHYCPFARNMFGNLLREEIPFLYIPFDSTNPRKKKPDYWRSLEGLRHTGAPLTFPAVMLLDGDKTHNWGKQSDNDIFQHLLKQKDSLRKQLRSTLTTEKFTQRFDTVADSVGAWRNFENNKAFIFLPN